MFELTNSLDLQNDFLETKKRGRQQRGADGKFESLLKESDFNGPTFSVANQGKPQNPMGRDKLSMRKDNQFIRRDKLNSRTRQSYNQSMQPNIKPKRQGARGPVASQFFGDVPGESLNQDEINRQAYFGSSFDMKQSGKGGLESQEQGISAEEMFNSPVKLQGGGDVALNVEE